MSCVTGCFGVQQEYVSHQHAPAQAQSWYVPRVIQIALKGNQTKTRAMSVVWP